MRSSGNAVFIGAADPASPDAAWLIAQLSATLAAITGDDGASSFDPDEMRAADALFVLARNAQGQAVGCAGLRRLGPDVAELKRMFAVPGSRGVGAAVLAYLEAAAAALGYKALQLSTRVVNQGAVAFYERHGFKRIPNFGKYAGSTRSVCFIKAIQAGCGAPTALA